MRFDEPRDNTYDLDSRVYAILREARQRLLDGGIDPETADAKIGEGLSDGLTHASVGVVETLFERAPQMLREHRRERAALSRHLRAVWGDALDAFYMAYVCARELLVDFDRRNLEQAKVDARLHVLIGLHGRGCRIASEVHHLLSGGFPGAALARTRTLHETAVDCWVIFTHGKHDGTTPDLAQRFLDHADVIAYQDAKTFQAVAPEIGYEPFSDDAMATLKTRHDARIAQYGSPFARMHGWATGVDRYDGRQFVDLEKLAELSHLRSHYKDACHEVHADAKSFMPNMQERGEVLIGLAGPTDLGLADAGHGALVSLHQTLVPMTLAVEPASPGDMLLLTCVKSLVDRAGELFLAADKRSRRQGDIRRQPDSDPRLSE